MYLLSFSEYAVEQILGDKELKAYFNCNFKQNFWTDSQITKLQYLTKIALFHIPLNAWENSFSASEQKNFFGDRICFIKFDLIT